MRENIQCLSFFVWVTILYMIFSSSIYFPENFMNPFFYMTEQSSVSCRTCMLLTFPSYCA